LEKALKTIFIDLDTLLTETKKDLLGFVLERSYNFRQIDFVGAKTSKTLVVETGNKAEQLALNAFLKQAKVSVSLVIGKGNKAGLGGSKLGTFKETSAAGLDSGYWLDRSTGKKFFLDNTK
jgi:hypothetical protein